MTQYLVRVLFLLDELQLRFILVNYLCHWICITWSVTEETAQDVKIKANKVSRVHCCESPFWRDISGVVPTLPSCPQALQVQALPAPRCTRAARHQHGLFSVKPKWFSPKPKAANSFANSSLRVASFWQPLCLLCTLAKCITGQKTS